MKIQAFSRLSLASASILVMALVMPALSAPPLPEILPLAGKNQEVFVSKTGGFFQSSKKPFKFSKDLNKGYDYITDSFPSVHIKKGGAMHTLQKVRLEGEHEPWKNPMHKNPYKEIRPSYGRMGDLE